MNVIRLKIKRQDRPGAGAYWEGFEVCFVPDATVAAVLVEIRKRPLNHRGEAVPPVLWSDACAEDACGACTMLINGKPRPACVTPIAGLEQPIRLEPLSKFPVVRDLVVDRSRMADAFRRVKAWIGIDGTHDLGAGPRVSPADGSLAEALSRCTECGACLEACPQYGVQSPFLGAAAIHQARVMNLHPTGRFLARERADILMEPGGVEDCGNAQNCVKVCPSGLPLTESIALMRREVTKRVVRRFFG